MHSIDLNGKACTGCGACVNVCPKSCISMQPDAEGFYYPSVDTARCVDCGLCLQTCPAHQLPQLRTGLCCMAVLSKDAQAVQPSASGGVFYTLGKWFIEQGGVVCGAVWGQDKKVRHVCADTLDGLRAMQDSKYVQSSTAECYARIKAHLRDGKKVLFSGTPCQIAGLYACVGEHELLWTVDIVCHGVPSPVFFERHITRLEEKHHKQAQQIRFRLKDRKNRTVYRLRLFENGRCWYDAYYKQNVYYSLFMDGASCRESCYTCPYARGERIGDLTMGDLGSYQAYPDFHPHEATSTVLINSQRGYDLWKKTMHGFDSREISFEKEQRANHQLREPAVRPALRDTIYSVLAQLPEETVYRRYCARLSAREMLSLTIKRYIPTCVIQWIRNHSTK